MPAQDPTDLPAASTSQLRLLWQNRVASSKPHPPRSRTLLLRDLTWPDQQAHHGGFDAETARLLSHAIRTAERPSSRTGASKPRPRALKPSRLTPGTSLLRIWHGVTHEVHVEATSRFSYRGKPYRSLSAIAREITGARWSGPRFFGLQKP
ncbi:MAG: DUF2924 domain-containing protein [Phycisphaeraceae bacterium]